VVTVRVQTVVRIFSSSARTFTATLIGNFNSLVLDFLLKIFTILSISHICDSKTNNSNFIFCDEVHCPKRVRK